MVGLLLMPGLSQADTIPDSKKREVEKIIEEINRRIKEKGYRWKAGVTSLSYLSDEESKRLCGVLLDPSQVEKALARQDSIYKEYKASKERSLRKALAVPDWKSLMSPIEQAECSNCWAHAATGVVEGLLHYLHGSNIGIDLDEWHITTHASCGGCGGGGSDCGLWYMLYYKAPSESGINSFPNYDHAYYTIVSESSIDDGIGSIKSALGCSPVNATMQMYEDYKYYTGGIYRHVWGEYLGLHSVVIVGYNDEDEYWICKDCRGTAWGKTVI